MRSKNDRFSCVSRFDHHVPKLPASANVLKLIISLTICFCRCIYKPKIDVVQFLIEHFAMNPRIEPPHFL